MKTIKVTQSFAEPFMVPFSRGEVLTVSDEQAEAWIAMNFAVVVKALAETATATPVAETATLPKPRIRKSK